MFISLSSSGKYLSNKASGVDFCIIPDFWHVNHWFIRLLNRLYIHNDSDCYHSCTQIICWWTKSQCPVLAKCWEEKTLEMKTYIVATIVLLVCCLFELAMKLVLLVCYLFEPTMKRSSILPPVIKPSLKSQTVNTRRIWSPKLSMPC